MVSVVDTKSAVHFTPKPSTTKMILPATLRDASSVLVRTLTSIDLSTKFSINLSEYQEAKAYIGADVEDIQFVAKGGFNTVFLVKLSEKIELPSELVNLSNPVFDRFIIRIANKDSLLPYQITNEIAWREYIMSKLPQIPVPRVYVYDTKDPNHSFIAEEFISGTQLSKVWMTYSIGEKKRIARKLATFILDMAETRHAFIGGLRMKGIDSAGEPKFELAPTVEGCKIFKDRNLFHDHKYYNIGPYETIKNYVLAYYEKEIYFYFHATAQNLEAYGLDDSSRVGFVEVLRKKRQELLVQLGQSNEPFVLVHGDFHGRNIMMKDDGEIAAVLDWEFAGSFPLSETETFVDIVEADSKELDEENNAWGWKIEDYIRDLALERAWSQADINLLMGNGNPIIQKARTEMFPAEFMSEGEDSETMEVDLEVTTNSSL